MVPSCRCYCTVIPWLCKAFLDISSGNHLIPYLPAQVVPIHIQEVPIAEAKDVCWALRLGEAFEFLLQLFNVLNPIVLNSVRKRSKNIVSILHPL